MALQENLTKENIDDWKHTFEERVAPINRQQILEEKVASLETQVSELTTLIKSIFDGHVLIDGQFRKICP